MQLLIDLGNTRVKWALLDSDGALMNGGSQANSGLLDKSLVPFDVSSAVLCSVASEQLTQKHIHAIKSGFGCTVNQVRVSRQFEGLQNRYQSVDSLGVDRWVAAIGARALYPQKNLIIVDAGTAITADLVSADSEFQGGVIVPGLRLMLESLTGNTAQVKSAWSGKAPLIGRNTQECVNSGVSNAVVGGLERIVKAMQEKYPGETVKVLVCGGDAEWLLTQTEMVIEHQPDLLFLGLMQFADAACRGRG